MNPFFNVVVAVLLGAISINRFWRACSNDIPEEWAKPEYVEFWRILNFVGAVFYILAAVLIFPSPQ